MSRLNLFVVILLVLTLIPSSPSVSAQSPDVETVSNGIYDVFVRKTGSDIGTYTIGTGVNHPVTISTGSRQSVLFNGDQGGPGAGFTTIRSYTSNTDYVAGDFHDSDFAVINLDAYSSGTIVIGSNEIQNVWDLPGPPATPDKLEILQNIKILGNNFSNSSIEIRISVTNLSTNQVSLGARYFWDLEIGRDDGPTFTQVNQDGTTGAALTRETEFQLPAFESFYIQDNDRNPNPPTFGVHGTVTGPSSFAPTAPAFLQFVAWDSANQTAFDYTVDSNEDISNVGGDSAVIYIFGPNAASAFSLGELQTFSIATNIFATSADSDLDGDQLLNSWEMNDTDLNGDGVIDVGPSVGSDPNRKDIYVEVDWMEATGLFHPSHKPKPEAIQKVVDAFAAQGINLHVDVGPDSIDYVTGVAWGQNSNGNEFAHEELIGDPSNDTELAADWERLRQAHFGHSDRVYRYALFAHEATSASSGNLLGRAVPQYFFVSLGRYGVGSVNQQAAVFMHELGHTLGLLHGGNENDDPSTPEEDDFYYKPNYLSIMNYSFSTSGLIINGSDGNMDYSRYDLPDLNEANLIEADGLNDGRVSGYSTKYRADGPCNLFGLFSFYKISSDYQPINWDCDLGTDNQPVQVDINGTGGNAQLLTSWDDWAHLNFKTGNIGLAVAGNPIPITVEDLANSPKELTFEEDLRIQRISDPRVQLFKTVDLSSVQPGGIVTYTITMLNIDGQDANNVVITDTLPNGFSYIAGSTSGATTNDPVIDGQNLTWSPFTVPANDGGLTLSFQARASNVPGTYFNNVGGSSSNGYVISTGDTAQVEVISTPTQSLYLSLNNAATVGSIAAQDVDILSFDGTTWSMFFDGSDVGISTTNQDMNEFHILDTDTILMTFDELITLGTLTADPWDVVRFDATSLGENTAGTFSMYLDGNDVGLDTTNEYLDGLHVLSDGRVLLSTTGSPTVSGVSGAVDEDILAFIPTMLGDVTSGTWSMYFDGSDVGLADSSNEDVDAVAVHANGDIYLSTAVDFAVTGISGFDEDVFICTPTSLGSVTACNYSPSLYFDGSVYGLDANDVDGIHLTLP